MNDILNSVQKEVPITIKEKHTPAEYFKDREGLYVYGSFENNILNKAVATEAGTEFKIASSDLKEDASDEEIEKTLGDKHLFSETEVCAIIADLIEKQPKGEEGTLLNSSGYANLFYTPSHVVHVYWISGRGGWHVGDWYRGGKWLAGKRVFSPATSGAGIVSTSS